MLVALLTLVACTTPDADNRDVSQAFDPFEDENRRTHEFNKSLDRALLRPAGRGYQTAVPIPVQAAVGNFSSNLSMPGVAVNSLLQGDLGGTGLAIVRFAMNSTIGIGGLIDAASEFNVPDHDTDFGETLHVWGTPEGAFIELPFLGPSTERDAVGRFVDLFTNPLTYAVTGSDRFWGYSASVASSVSDRGRFSETIDYILYESADSYAQSRLIYLQNRRFELGQGSATEDDGTDPYDDFYSDPYDDPYEDPYAE
jgi:phospholipid-binding lipoprotein MlaA